MTDTFDDKLQTNQITPELIDCVVDKIVHAIQPEKIILYGSYVRGDYHKDSDLDLFIIKDSEETSRMLTRKVDSLFDRRRFSLDVRVRKPSEDEWNIEAQNPFERIGKAEVHEAIEAAEAIEALVLTKLGRSTTSAAH